jgi:hypothetical protein
MDKDDKRSTEEYEKAFLDKFEELRAARIARELQKRDRVLFGIRDERLSNPS